jgi:hypothetical protein
VPLQLAHAPLIAGMGLAGALGQIALTKAFQLGEASMIAPLEYSGLVWVIGWDLAFWGQLPDGYTWVGAAIIVASGLYLLHRERLNREAAEAAGPSLSRLPACGRGRSQPSAGAGGLEPKGITFWPMARARDRLRW